jgi:hypothetical protein
MTVDLVGELQHYVAAIPAWLQVPLFYYVAVLLGSWARGRFLEKRSFWMAVLALTLAVFLAARATSMLYVVFFGPPV